LFYLPESPLVATVTHTVFNTHEQAYEGAKEGTKEKVSQTAEWLHKAGEQAKEAISQVRFYFSTLLSILSYPI